MVFFLAFSESDSAELADELEDVEEVDFVLFFLPSSNRISSQKGARTRAWLEKRLTFDFEDELATV